MCAQILVLLEHDDNSQLVIDALERSGHEVIRTRSFKDAIAFLHNKSVGLILSDVHFENGGNVFDFLVWKNRNLLTTNTPFVLFSYQPTPLAKHLQDGVRTTARLLGAASYITVETFNAGEFRKEIDSLLLAPDNPLNAIEKLEHYTKTENGE
jgi:CheY-like chemotaxis protein